MVLFKEEIIMLVLLLLQLYFSAYENAIDGFKFISKLY